MPENQEEETLNLSIKVRFSPTQKVALERVAKRKKRKAATLARELVLLYLLKNDAEYRASEEKELGTEAVAAMLAPTVDFTVLG